MPDPSNPAADSTMLLIQQLTRRFGGLTAVDQVSFEVKSQEIFGLIGPNGAGKTTLFNLITGLISPSGGNLQYQGQMITGFRPHQVAAKGIARTFQNIRLFGNLSVLENVMIANHIQGRGSIWGGVLGFPSTAQDELRTYQNAWELLDLVGLADRAQEYAKNLPYGDQRRLEIARALALKPQTLLLDEPAAGMNPNEKHQLSAFVRQIRERFNLTILLIEHHVPLVMGLCDQIAVLNFGKLIALGDPATVRRDPAVIEAYLGGE